jgi:hypothetical protein
MHVERMKQGSVHVLLSLLQATGVGILRAPSSSQSNRASDGISFRLCDSRNLHRSPQGERNAFAVAMFPSFVMGPQLGGNPQQLDVTG